ncbi:hypothetical protein Acr_28g0011950 [Actinidia rufa]|uniref:Uncharacterized protein n=1 Tax=Actinidia rufa TaxID=165716 RepID=A0A7J0HBK8_9ERIC|nr:hypothetical protein Acr_28g0011950 [Actinidia rufa]
MNSISTFRLRSILIHSLNHRRPPLPPSHHQQSRPLRPPIFYFRFHPRHRSLGCSAAYVHSNHGVATAPWAAQLFMSTAIMVLYNTGVGDRGE